MTITVTTWRSRYAEDVSAEEFCNWRWPNMTKGTNDVATGKITHVNSEKGYFFVRPDNGGADQFGHVTGLIGDITTLRPGDRVSFDITIDPRKAKEKAVNVRVIPG